MKFNKDTQYPNSCYHPDSTLKAHFHISKVAKSADIDKKGKSVKNLGGLTGVPKGINRDQQESIQRKLIFREL